MNFTKIFSLNLTFAFGVIVCLTSTACTFDSHNAGISIEKKSRFQQMQNVNKNPRVVYLGDNDRTTSRSNFGPRDVSFEMESLR